MYEELIKSLRETSIDFGESDHVSVMMIEAADAIEKLDAIAQTYAETVHEIEDKRKWIPVTERLPEDGKFVLVCNDDGHMMIAKHETETYEWYYKYTNYDFDIWENEEQGPVCYWMPLPQSPESEGE